MRKVYEEMLIKKIKDMLWANDRDLVAIERVDNGTIFTYNNYKIIIQSDPIEN